MGSKRNIEQSSSAHLIRRVRPTIVRAPRAAQMVPQARRCDALAFAVHRAAGVAACTQRATRHADVCTEYSADCTEPCPVPDSSQIRMGGPLAIVIMGVAQGRSNRCPGLHQQPHRDATWR